MDSDRIKGTVRAAAGTVETRVGALAGDEKMRVDGLSDQLAGRAQTTFGQAKDAWRDSADRAAAYAENAYDRTRRAAEDGAHALNLRIEANPVMAILVAGAIGYLLAMVARQGRR